MWKINWSLALPACIYLTACTGTALALRVCYRSQHIGCFNNRPPHTNTFGLLPQSPRHIQVGYLLFTPPQTLTTESVSQSNFQGSKKTKFIIHGFQERGTKQWPRVMADAILQQEDVNVIIVDWENGADSSIYFQAAANTRVVGALIARLVKALHKARGATYSSIHLIGFSLGAHVAGHAGKRLPALGRITGLDPAGPAFENEDEAVRLDPSDTAFVDVIHTDGDSLRNLGLGLQQRAGHADFYPNGGRQQPGCTKPLFVDLSNILGEIDCSHTRALDLFIESITSDCVFRGYPCASNVLFKDGLCGNCGTGCAVMGYHADNLDTPTGTFFLSTDKESPFCLD